MKAKKAPRVAATNNGAKHHKHIVSDRRLKNKIRNAVLRGTTLGATMAALIGCMYTEVNPFVGCVVSGAALGYMGLFYGINRDDAMYGGVR